MMRVAIFGGTGFVGTHLTNYLSENNFKISMLAREGSESKIQVDKNITIINGEIKSKNSISETLEGCDFVIYNIGILNEFANDGVTFESLQYQGLKRVVDQCSNLSIRKFILMSASGVENNITKYQKTKLSAEEYLKGSGLTYTIFRPSVIFGDPQGKMEFATQLFNEMIRPPIPAVNFFIGMNPITGSVKISPVHIHDVVKAFHKALTSDDVNNKIFILGGPKELSWNEMIKVIMMVTNKQKLILPIPIALMKIVVRLFSWLPFLPVTYDQLLMLEQGNHALPDDLIELIGKDLHFFNNKNLNYLRIK